MESLLTKALTLFLKILWSISILPSSRKGIPWGEIACLEWKNRLILIYILQYLFKLGSWLFEDAYCRDKPISAMMYQQNNRTTILHGQTESIQHAHSKQIPLYVSDQRDLSIELETAPVLKRAWHFSWKLMGCPYFGRSTIVYEQSWQRQIQTHFLFVGQVKKVFLKHQTVTVAALTEKTTRLNCFVEI